MGQSTAHLERELQALREEVEQLKRTSIELEALSHLGHWALDLVSGALSWSPEIFHLFGLDAETFTPSYAAFLDAVHPEDRALVNQTYAASVESRTPYKLIHRLLSSDDTVRYVQERGRTEYDDAGQPLRSLGTVQDISERVLATERDRKLGTLESLGVLAGGIANDFNNYLLSIMGNIELALDEMPTHEGRQLLGDAYAASQEAHATACQLLTFSSGGTPDRSPLLIQEVIAGTARLTFTGHNVTAEVNIAADLWPIVGARAQIAQIVQSLVENACHAATNTVTLKAENVVHTAVTRLPIPRGRYVKITVCDDGPGVPTELRTKIFEPYFTTKETGSGLGLALTQSIVQRHDGHIFVEDGPKSGACFAIYLPPTDLNLPKRVQRSAPPLGKAEHLRILVVDDELMVRRTLKLMLERLGHEVTLATGTDTAIQAFQNALVARTPFNLSVIDLTLKGGPDGDVLAKQLISIDPDARLVLLTGYSASPAVADPQAYGFCAALAKPFDFLELRGLLNTVFPGSE